MPHPSLRLVAPVETYTCLETITLITPHPNEASPNFAHTVGSLRKYTILRGNSSEAKASRLIICKFPAKLPFPVHSGLQRASKSRYVQSNGVRPAGRRAFHHLRMCQYVFALYILFSAWFAFSDDDYIRQ